VPTYQYACTACGERLEAVQSFTDAPLTECPACAGALRKVFSAVGVVFKGSGFYKTDSRAPAKSGASSEGKSDGSGDAGGKGDNSKAESKSDGKSDSKGGDSKGKAESTSSKPATPAASSPAPASKSA
jgi:putative FmdB family regulatory protein